MHARCLLSFTVGNIKEKERYLIHFNPMMINIFVHYKMCVIQHLFIYVENILVFTGRHSHKV